MSDWQKDTGESSGGREGYLARKNSYLEQNNIKAAVREMGEACEMYPEDRELLIEYIAVLIRNNVDDPRIDDLIYRVKRLRDDDEIADIQLRHLYKTGRFKECKALSESFLKSRPGSDVSKTASALLLKIKDRQEKEGGKDAQPIDSLAEEAERRLNALIGLNLVKQEIFKIKKKIEFDRARSEALGIACEEQDVYHFVFLGNPGTGKTTVARLLTDILHGVGLLKTGQLIEVERVDLVGEYQGQTAVKTKGVIEKALGGVLFIDEAYSLVKGERDDFGREAIDALVKGVEDHRNEFVVILAGYRDEMQKLISSNIGLESRFTKFIDFPDYTEDELLEIAKAMAGEQHYSFSPDGELAFREKIGKKRVNRKFGNARAVRTLMNEAYTEKAIRFDPERMNFQYMTILTPEDFGIDLSKDSEQKAKEALKKLERLTGLQNVKYEINSTVKMVDYLKKERADGNADNIAISDTLHMCFTGNPGTGKTTVARLYAEVLAALGVSRTGELTEASRGDFVGRYQGETAFKTGEICESSYGGVLFIDEAYDLVQGETDSFGREAVAALIKQMEDNRDKMIVIFAGYSAEMEAFMESNPGIRSRISKIITFPDYNLEELYSIFFGFAEEKNVTFGDGAEIRAREVIKELYEGRDDKFGNARDMRNLFEAVWRNMVDRVETYRLTGADRRIITAEDFENNK